MTTFTGFSKEGDDFFRALALKQDRDWFKAHKADYERLWATPMKELLETLRPQLAKTFKGLSLAPNKVFRLQRDVRFSKDKSPYKTYAGAMIKVDAGSGSDMFDGGPAAVYLHLGSENLVALGHWVLTPPQLKGYRQLLLDDRRGAVLARRAAALRDRGFTVTAFEQLKRVPPGVDPDHPRAWLLKLKGLGFELPKIPTKVRYSPKLASWVIDQVKLAAPVVVALERERRSW